MNKKLKIIAGITLFFVSFLSCKQEKSEVEARPDVEKQLIDENFKTLKANKENLLLIKEDGFYGITVGSSFKAVPQGILQIGQLKKNKVSFEVNYIVAENGEILAYILPDSLDKDRIGSIVITSKKAETKDGLKIGSTFVEILKWYPEIEVNGTEIEGSTYANTGDISFKLNVKKYKYEVNESKIKPATKAVQIILKNKNY